MEGLTAAAWTGFGAPVVRWALCGLLLLTAASDLLAGSSTEHAPTSIAISIAAYAAALCGALLLTSRGDHRLDAPHSAGVAASALVAAALILSTAPASGQLRLFDFCSYLLGLLLIRGGTAVATAGCAALLTAGAIWSTAAGGAPATTAGLLVVPVSAMLFGAIWRRVLRGIVARERRHRTASERAALRTGLALEAAAADRDDLVEVRREAGPLLERVAAGEPITEGLHRELRLVEAGIRDRIRSPWSAHPELAAAIVDRRRRGMDVRLLGEGAGDRCAMNDRLSEAIAAIVRDAEHGSITVHASPAGRRAAASVRLDDGAAVTRVLLAADGSEISRA